MRKRKLLIKLLVDDVYFFIKNIIYCKIEIKKLKFISKGHLKAHDISEKILQFNSRRELRNAKK